MQAIGALRQIAAGELVGTLGAGLHPLKLAGDGEIDGLVVAGLEMQVLMVLERPPVPAIKRIRANEIKRTGDDPARPPGEDQENVIGHALADMAEKAPRQIGAPPLARARINIEGKEGI